ncbi:winged helix-turn-helix transcriptional regulator [Clostridioides sp. ZZV15-6597]|uniref:winged helix-turn-helix transcriptional regulator n=1 Tax=Clostridioides sp. ZZV15-6597 TaxID=2811500 RepID=UPI001D1048D3|nr:helix-turn-helix transcriptional regulator [Clostridioides sp. ZZV15-6597]
MKKYLPACPVEITLQMIGDKWKFLILRELISGKKRFGELSKSIENISQKMLSQNLKSMEEEGLVHREAYAQVPPKVEYSLTELGMTLRPILVSLFEWGNMYKEYNKKESKHE